MTRPDGFVSVLRAAGLMLDVAVPDGRLRRVRAEGDAKGQRSGWYVLHAAPRLAGAYGNWKSGLSESWCEAGSHMLSDADRAALHEAVKRAQRQQQAERAQRQAVARQQARERWQRACAATADHPYLVSKGVGAHGVRQLDGLLLVPLRDAQGRLWSLQTIAADGSKRFLAGGRKHGLYYAVGRTVATWCASPKALPQRPASMKPLDTLPPWRSMPGTWSQWPVRCAPSFPRQ